MIGWLAFALTVLGTLFCGAYLALHRPTYYFSRRVVNAMGWELVVFIVLLRASIQLAYTHHTVYHNSSSLQSFFSITSLALIDILIGYKLMSFTKFRGYYDTEIERLQKESDKS